MNLAHEYTTGAPRHSPGSGVPAPGASRPILFSAPMVRALLDGRKTQTRRAVKLPAWAESSTQIELDDYAAMFDLRGPYAVCRKTGCLAQITCPYGRVGDTLWVRETFAHRGDSVYYRATTGCAYDGAWRPAIHMPRRLSRIALRITAVRCERLQSISEADAEAEAAEPIGVGYTNFRGGYHLLWDLINGPGSWLVNPWVWVLEFEVVNQESRHAMR